MGAEAARAREAAAAAESQLELASKQIASMQGRAMVGLGGREAEGRPHACLPASHRPQLLPCAPLNLPASPSRPCRPQALLNDKGAAERAAKELRGQVATLQAALCERSRAPVGCQLFCRCRSLCACGMRAVLCSSSPPATQSSTPAAAAAPPSLQPARRGSTNSSWNCWRTRSRRRWPRAPRWSSSCAACARRPPRRSTANSRWAGFRGVAGQGPCSFVACS